MKSSVYIVKENEFVNSLIPELLNQFNEDLDFIALIGCVDFEGLENLNVKLFDNLSQYLIHIYRELKLHKNARQTIYGEEDQLLATQLCMASYNREKYDSYDVATSEVLATSNRLSRDAIDMKNSTASDVSASSKEEHTEIARCYQEFLKTCNSTDLAAVFLDVKSELLKSEETAAKYCNNSKSVVLEWPRNIVEASFLSLLCHTTGRYFHTTAEIPVGIDISQLSTELIVIHTEEVVLPSCEDMLVKWSPSSCSTSSLRKPTTDNSLSGTEVYFKRVFLSYLTLVINTRDELALARCFNVPDRELDHEAFTALKHEASQKNMPMCQTATSYVMRIRIGGKGHIPDMSCQISQYVRGLSEFVNLILKLQVILEEEENPRSGLLRLLNQIKVTFLKSKHIGFKKDNIEKVVRYLKLSVGKLSAEDNGKTPAKSVGNGGSMAGEKTIKLLRRLLDQEASHVAPRRPVDVLCDGLASQGTPVRLPSLLSMFRSPAIPSPDSPENQSLVDRLLQKENDQQVSMKRMGYRSCMMWADPNDLQKEKSVNVDYVRAINNDNTQRSPSNGWKNTIWASDDNHNGQMIDTELLENVNSETILDAIEKNSNDNACHNTAKVVRADETPKGRGKAKRKPFREMNEQNVMKKAKKDNHKSKKKKPIPQVKGQKTLSNFFRV
ncbi:PCNA-interacting partner-like [Anneissia japonica]|uniref:PCNA-interacting partner-like n=1 Tax=Anneissia japonica TaxID=1529436 RepID=UPI0014255BDD|nr:PCNA-interacting partner-like [Anneissia japonica]